MALFKKKPSSDGVIVTLVNKQKITGTEISRTSDSIWLWDSVNNRDFFINRKDILSIERED